MGSGSGPGAKKSIRGALRERKSRFWGALGMPKGVQNRPEWRSGREKIRSEDPSRKRRGPSADFLTFCIVFLDFVPVFDDISETLFGGFWRDDFWGETNVFSREPVTIRPFGG